MPTSLNVQINAQGSIVWGQSCQLFRERRENMVPFFSAGPPCNLGFILWVLSEISQSSLAAIFN